MKFDNQTLFNLANSIGSSSKVPTLFPNEYELWALHMEDYLLGLENGYLIWKSVSDGPCKFPNSKDSEDIWGETTEQYEILKSTPGMNISKENRERIELDLKAKRELRFALPPNVFRLVRNCKTAHEIWDKLKIMYGANEKQRKSQQTAVLSEFGAFKQKSDESLEQCFDRFNMLLSQLEKFDLGRQSIEQKVTFLQGLKVEWKNISTTVKGHEKFDEYSIYELFGLLKTHEDDVVEVMKATPGGANALLTKSDKKVKFATPEQSTESEESDDDEAEEKALMAYAQRKFYKNKFNSGAKFNKFAKNNANPEKKKEEKESSE